jgi:hypothetical protein
MNEKSGKPCERRFSALHLVAPKGFEPSISWLRTMHPGPLDDGATALSLGEHANSISKAVDIVNGENELGSVKPCV